MSLYLSSSSSHHLRGNMGLGACGHLGVSHLEALVTASGSGAGIQRQAAGALLVSPPGP